MTKSKQRLVVKPRGFDALYEASEEIVKIANQAGYVKRFYFDVVGFYEFLAGKIPDTFRFHVANASEFPDPSHEGLTKPNGEILIREDVYDGAIDDNGRDRFTMTHELLHWFLHRKDFGLARSNQNVPAYKCPEWQANTAASFSLMPTGAVIQASGRPSELEKICKVSFKAAEVRCDIYERRNL